MIPLLNITAPQASEAPIQIGGSTSGQPTGDGLFAQMFAKAMGVVPQQTMVPSIGVPVVTETAVTQATAAKLLAANNGTEAVDSAVAPTESIVQLLPGSKVSDAAAVLPNQIDPATLPTGEIALDATEVHVNRAQNGDPLIELIANTTPSITESSLVDRVETELASVTSKNSSGVMVNAQVELSDVAANALTTNADKVSTTAAAKVVSEESIQVSGSEVQQKLKIATSLKSNLKRSFPSLNIESASTKVNIQVKLSSTQGEAQSKPEVTLPTQRTVAMSELPITSAPQFVAAVAMSGQAQKPVRIERNGQTAVKTTTPEIAKPAEDVKTLVQVESRLVARKPVQVALKQQGFDVEKLINAGGNAKESLVENLAIDKTDFKVAVDKQAAHVTNNSFELNGTERFKLDIKQGHIEALLKKGEIKIQLQPEHLGNLRIRLMTTPTEVNARLETSSEDARRAVEHSLPQLRESFERAGLRLNSIEVSVNDDRDSRRQSAFQQEWHGRNSESRTDSGKFTADIPATAEISRNLYTAYGGALNLVA